MQKIYCVHFYHHRCIKSDIQSIFVCAVCFIQKMKIQTPSLFNILRLALTVCDAINSDSMVHTLFLFVHHTVENWWKFSSKRATSFQIHFSGALSFLNAYIKYNLSFGTGFFLFAFFFCVKYTRISCVHTFHHQHYIFFTIVYAIGEIVFSISFCSERNENEKKRWKKYHTLAHWIYRMAQFYW